MSVFDIVALFGIFAFANAAPTSTTQDHRCCGNTPVSQSRVIDGLKNAEPGAWPWQVALKNNGTFICGGSLISDRWVITAAHCVSTCGCNTQSMYEVVTGDHNLNTTEGTEQTIPVKRVISHPNYNKPPLSSDIALIELAHAANLSDRVSPVCLPEQDYELPAGSKCYITGWGKYSGVSWILQQTMIPSLSQASCKTKAQQSGFGIEITDQVLCAGKEDTILSGCHGDNGGPYVCVMPDGRYSLQGDVTLGTGSCNARFTVFGRVAKFRNWIDHHMRNGENGGGSSAFTRIVGGQIAAKNSWPWQAAIFRSRHSALPFCGGSLITSTHVITSAHCVYGKKLHNIRVRLGAHDFLTSRGWEHVVRIITHDFYRRNVYYDIAILELAEPVEFTPAVHPVQLATTDMNFSTGTNCTITGWGTVREGGSQPHKLMEAVVPLVSYNRCKSVYPFLRHTQICAGYDEGGIDACQGDSGGPLVCKNGETWYLEGITSLGHGCARPGYYGVYTKVPSFYDWILEKTANYH